MPYQESWIGQRRALFTKALDLRRRERICLIIHCGVLLSHDSVPIPTAIARSSRDPVIYILLHPAVLSGFIDLRSSNV